MTENRTRSISRYIFLTAILVVGMTFVFHTPLNADENKSLEADGASAPDTSTLNSINTPYEWNSGKKSPGKPAMSQGIGLTAGYLSGLGLAYRSFSGRWGFHIGGLIQAQKNDYQYNLGLQTMRKIIARDDFRFYAVGGIGLQCHTETKSRYYNRKTDTYEFNAGLGGAFDLTRSFPVLTPVYLWTAGAGVGIEWAPGSGPFTDLGFAVELPMMVSMSGYSNIFNYDWFLPIPSATVTYYFK